jgi:hypothetical protein
MKRKGKNPEALLLRTTKMGVTSESLINDLHDAADAPTVVCRDCKSPSPIESLITVDALHVQCPLCLYVFFNGRIGKEGGAASG